MNLDKIQMEQADTLRQEKILQDFVKKNRRKIKPKKIKPRSRDLFADAEAKLRT